MPPELREASKPFHGSCRRAGCLHGSCRRVFGRHCACGLHDVCRLACENRLWRELDEKEPTTLTIASRLLQLKSVFFSFSSITTRTLASLSARIRIPLIGPRGTFAKNHGAFALPARFPLLSVWDLQPPQTQSFSGHEKQGTPFFGAPGPSNHPKKGNLPHKFGETANFLKELLGSRSLVNKKGHPFKQIDKGSHPLEKSTAP